MKMLYVVSGVDRLEEPPTISCETRLVIQVAREEKGCVHWETGTLEGCVEGSQVLRFLSGWGRTPGKGV